MFMYWVCIKTILFKIINIQYKNQYNSLHNFKPWNEQYCIIFYKKIQQINKKILEINFKFNKNLAIITIIK